MRRFELTAAMTDIPINEYYEYFGPDYQLDVKSSNMEDMNTRGYVERVKGIVMEHLRQVGGPPSVQMQGISHGILTFPYRLNNRFPSTQMSLVGQ